MNYAPGMRFQVLGPLEVEADNGPVVLGGPKERLLLALLLTRPNQVVPVEALVRGLWGERPPPTAAKTLQSHVARLRRALEPTRARGAAGEVLVTREPGYLVRVAPGALDAAQFQELTAQARRGLSERRPTTRSLLREAWGCGAAGRSRSSWTLTSARPRATVWPSCGWSRWRIGSRPTSNWAGTVSWWPSWRSGPRAAAAGAAVGPAAAGPVPLGRQADALLAYQRARSILVEELGHRPRGGAAPAHAAILAQDPGLDLPAPTEAGRGRELPQALVPVGPVFAGRTAELAWLRAAWTRATDGRGGMVFVAGRQSMGKTRLAAALAQEVHDQGARGAVRPLRRGSVRPAAAIRRRAHERRRIPIRPAWARCWPVPSSPQPGARRRAGRSVRPGGAAGLG